MQYEYIMMKVNTNIKKNSSEKKSRHSIATNIQPRSLHKRDNPLDRVEMTISLVDKSEAIKNENN